MKTSDWSWQVSRTVSRISARPTSNGESYIAGLVLTHHGYVDADCWEDRKGIVMTSLSMMIDGREYRRSITGKMYTKRGLAIMAGKFAREMAELHGAKS